MESCDSIKENALNASIVSEFVVNLKYDELPKEVVQMAKRCFLDFLGVALGSDGLPAVNSGMGLLDALGRSEDTTIIGQKTKASLIGTIWVNSLLGSALDLEDGYYPSVGHPASVVFPVTLGLAEREHASPEEFISASVVGYEVCARSGALMTRTYRDKPRGSGGSSVYGASAAAARLLRLDQKHVEIALGIAGSYMSSVPVLRSHRHEAMIKGGIPWGTVVGVVSAFLGQQGFTSPPATLQDPFCTLDDESARVVLQTLGRNYEMLNVYFKRYPSCRWTHAALDATLAILQKHSIQQSSIRSILVETFQEALALNNYRPKSLEGLQFSLPYTIALSIVEGEFGVQQMSLQLLNNRSIQEMADRVKVIVDPTLNQMFPKRRPARVTITTVDGHSFTKEILEIHGEPGSNFAVEGVQDKFFQLVSGRFDKQRADKIYEIVDHLETLPSLQPLIEFLKG
jgi:2-methylcitrate dehydratase PrpD